MDKKGSMELSVNSIVILVIAIVMMGLILGFVNSRFALMDDKILIEEPVAPAATLSDPITMSRPSLKIASGDTIGLKFQVYALRAITETDKPIIECDDTGAPNFVINTNGKNAAKDTTVQYEGLVKVSNSAKGKYICELKFGTVNDAGLELIMGYTDPLDPLVETEYSKDLIVEIR